MGLFVVISVRQQIDDLAVEAAPLDKGLEIFGSQAVELPQGLDIDLIVRTIGVELGDFSFLR